MPDYLVSRAAAMLAPQRVERLTEKLADAMDEIAVLKAAMEGVADPAVARLRADLDSAAGSLLFAADTMATACNNIVTNHGDCECPTCHLGELVTDYLQARSRSTKGTK